MSMYECSKCGGVPGVTACCTDQKKALNMTEREQFEAWAKKAGWPHHFTSCNTKDPNAYSQESWEVWQAARAQPAQAVPVLSDEEIVYQTDEIPLGDGCFIKVARAVEQAVRAKLGVAVPMTHMQIVTLWGHRSDGPSTPEIVSFARLVERHHGIVGKEGGNANQA